MPASKKAKKLEERWKSNNNKEGLKVGKALRWRGE
jgi:hypothetical protein